MTSERAPSDLIQQALDILTSDKTQVRITCQASSFAGGGVAQWDGQLMAVLNSTMAPELVLARMRSAGEPVEFGHRDHMYIDFDSIIELERIEP